MPDFPTGTVTFLFTDIEGSTRLWEKQAEAMRPALTRHNALLRQAIEAHGGHVFKTIGDAFCTAFTNPLEALLAALAAQRALTDEGRATDDGGLGALSPPSSVALRVRMALHTGVVEETDRDYFGPPLNLVARLMGAGHGGQILLSQPTYELVRHQLPPSCEVRDLGEHRLKDLSHLEHVYQARTPDLPADFPPLKTLTERPNNLPLEPTSLIGREVETRQVASLLQRPDVRLVTLTGVGGTGKTRLGEHVAAALVDHFADGVYFVNLAPLSDPHLVASTLAQTLGVSEQPSRPLLDTLKDHLRDKQMLVLLDNFEQVVAVAPLVADLLQAAPGLKALVTSRVALRLRAEHEFPVPPMELPDIKRLPSLERLTEYEAVRLFIERAVAVKPDFRVSVENAGAVAEICYRLDGLPLTIELAAARIRLLPPEAMRQRLGRRLQWLTGGPRDLPARHQTLRDMLAWSYNLLDEAEQRLFRRLAVFVGGFGLEAVEAVCNADGDLGLDVLNGLSSLLDKNLILHLRSQGPQMEATDGEPRLTLLETIREYAVERLTDSGEADALRQRHAAFCLTLAEEASAHMGHTEAGLWLRRLEADHDNLRAALHWAASADAALGVRLTRALVPFWDLHGDHREGCSWLETALRQARGLGDREGEWQVLLDLGKLWAARNYAFTGDYYQQALALARQMDDARLLAHSLNQVGNWHVNLEQLDDSLHYHLEALELFRALGDRRGEAETLDHLGLVGYSRGDLVEGAHYYSAAIPLLRELDDRQVLASTMASLTMGSGHYSTDTMVAAPLQPLDFRRNAEMAVEIAREIGWRAGEAYARYQYSAYLGFNGEYGAAFEMGRTALAVAEEIEHRQWITGATWNLGVLYRDLLALSEARDRLERALSMAQEIGSGIWTYFATGMLAQTLVWQKEYAYATATLDRLLTPDTPTQTLSQRLLWSVQAELALAQGNAAQALHIVDQLLATAHHLQSRPLSAIPRLAYLRGQALAALKHAAEAEEALQSARDGAATRGNRPLLWRVHVALGRLYLTQGRGAEAQKEFASARTLIEALAANVADAALRDTFRQQALAMLPPLTVGTPRQAAKAEFGGLTEREREVAALIAQGKTNREIAEAMVVGRRTIETHISNIMAKLGFTTRAQIIAWAIELGLGLVLVTYWAVIA